jgi:phosphatidylglycerophosphate synthase
MIATKQIADLITLSRAILALTMIPLGLIQGASSLPIIVWFAIANWTLDSIDGPLARRAKTSHQSWIGGKDLEIDMFFGLCLLIYMVTAGLVTWLIALVYLLAWILIFWHWGLLHELGVFFQVGIYGWFILQVLRLSPGAAVWFLVWLVAALIVTWPKFPKIIVPRFMNGIRDIWDNRAVGRGH